MFTPKMTAITATTALIVAVFGSTPLGQAAAQMVLPENSVGTKQLKTAAVTSAKVKDHSLLASDFQTGQLGAGQAYCPAGKKPVAGGGAVSQGSPAYIVSSIPAASNSQSPNAWFVNWHNTKAASVSAKVFVVCANVS